MSIKPIAYVARLGSRRRQLFIKLSGASATVLVALLFSVVPAYASGSPLCASNGSGLCMSDEGNTQTGSAVRTENRNSGPNQNIALPMSTACGNGKVSNANACPFTPGSGLNSQYNGDAIVNIKFANTGVCLADTSQDPYGNAFVQACSGANGLDFVYNQANGGGEQLISVYASDHAPSGPYAICLASIGQGLPIYGEQIGGCSIWGR